jgi:hypothetical protein
MPNWCDNRLHISGDIETIKTFIQKVTNTEEQAEKRRQRYDILQNLYPCPQELTDTVSGFSHDENVQSERQQKYDANKAKYGYKDWYDWQYAKWGTKWGDSDTDIIDPEPFITPDGRAHAEFVFQSPWSPPIEGIAHITTMFPTLEFGIAYYEEGMDFYGFCNFVDGVPLDDCREISEIEGMEEICALMDEDDCEIDVWEKRNDLICEARDRLLEEAGF